MRRRPTKLERVEAYGILMRLAKTDLTRYEIVTCVWEEYDISKTTLYNWLADRERPACYQNRLHYCKEIFYVVGALLGDGCFYYWKKGSLYQVKLTGDKTFADRYADKLSTCLRADVKAYKRGGKNFWFVNRANTNLYRVFQQAKTNLKRIDRSADMGCRRENLLEFIAGFFDAEGCIKIIKEPCRKTPKICLDITNTWFELLELVKAFIEEALGIEARYSSQAGQVGPNGIRRKTSYHLRIYKKSSVERFLAHVHTTKLYSSKMKHVKKWLGEGHSPLASS